MYGYATPTHTHSFTYSASGATITATCSADDCTLPEVEGKHIATLTIAAPLHTTYGDGKDATAVITDANSIQGDAKVQYQKKTDGSYGTATEAAPTDAGDYKASITVGGATASVEYTIAKADSTANAPTGLTATYGQTLADVSLEGKNPEGNTPGTWAWADAATTSVGSVGAHTFKANFTPTDTTNYNSKSNVDVTVTVGKAANPATVSSTASVTKGGKTVDLASNVALNGATGAISYAIDGEAKGCTLNGSVLTSGDNTGSVIVNVTVAADSNYEALAATPITVTISDKATQTITASNVTATYGDTGKKVSATASGAISYAVKSGSDVIEVNSSTGALTIRKAGAATVTVTAAETATCAQATKDVTVTVNKATVTVKAKDQSIKVGDAVPTLTGESFYTVTGLVGEDTLTTPPTLAYQKDSEAAAPDNTKAGTYDIVPSGAAAGDNYDISYTKGTLTISARQSSGGGSSSSGGGSSSSDSGSSSTPSTPSTPAADTHISETATAADGAAVTKEVDASTTTKQNSDGSTTVTDTVNETLKTENPDGTKVETATESTKAKTTNSVKNSDGSVTDTTKVQNTETVKETATDANGSKTVTETKTEQEQNTAVTTKDNADGSKSEKTETTETVKVTEKVTDGSGKVTETVTTTKTETVTDMTAAQDGTATGTSTTTTTVTDDKGKVLSTTVTEAEIKASTNAEGVVTTETTATVTKTDADGNVTTEQTVTTAAKAPDGSTGTIVKDESGKVLSQETTISQQEAEKARDEGRPAQSPLKVTPVPETVEDKAAPVQVNMPPLLYDRDGDSIVTLLEMAKVEIQVTYDGPGVVAKEYGADGTLRIVKECREGSVIVPVTGSGELVIVDNTKAFNDVNATDWYGEYVTFVTAREIFNGTGGGTFSPNATMTRAMLAQVLYNFARDSAAGDGTAFEDVNAADWFNAAIGWAYENGVVNGYGSRFGAQDNISRQDLATILYRFAKAAGYDASKSASLDGFADAGDVADYAKEAMQWAVGAGLINGTDGKLAAQQSATRAQVTAIMTRFVRGIR